MFSSAPCTGNAIFAVLAEASNICDFHLRDAWFSGKGIDWPYLGFLSFCVLQGKYCNNFSK
jgi:hypothetical protein